VELVGEVKVELVGGVQVELVGGPYGCLFSFWV
jgi:hypothetical protein